jgi:hypothetical protein
MSEEEIKNFLLNSRPVGFEEVDENMPDISRDPYFVNKHEQARKILKKTGIPEDFKTKKK